MAAALVFGTSAFGRVGSNPTTSSFGETVIQLPLKLIENIREFCREYDFVAADWLPAFGCQTLTKGDVVKFKTPGGGYRLCAKYGTKFYHGDFLIVLDSCVGRARADLEVFNMNQRGVGVISKKFYAPIV